MPKSPLALVYREKKKLNEVEKMGEETDEKQWPSGFRYISGAKE